MMMDDHVVDRCGPGPCSGARRTFGGIAVPPGRWLGGCVALCLIGLTVGCTGGTWPLFGSGDPSLSSEPSIESVDLGDTAYGARHGDIIGELSDHRASHEDTLIDLARPNNLGYLEIAAANPGIDPWVPGEATRIVLPTAHVLPPAAREGLVINLAEQRLYYFPADGRILTFPIGIGREGWETPTGQTKVVKKRKEPTWYPPASIRAENPELPGAVPPGPDNPLGTRALYLGWPTYLIHGTNEPDGVGRRVSHGCLRLYPEHVEYLFAMVPVNTPVQVIDQPIKLGWSGDELFMEVHPTRRQSDQLEEEGAFEDERIPEAHARIVEAAAEDADRLDWTLVGEVLRRRHGVPVQITRLRGDETQLAYF